MNIRKALHYLLVIICFSLAVITCDVTPKQDREFERKILDNLKEHGDTVSVAKIHHGEWSKVCPVMEYQRASKNAAWGLNIKPDEIIIVNTSDQVASSSDWGFVFLYPPNRAEYLRVSKFFYTSSVSCASPKKAKFELVHRPGDAPRLKLMED